MKMTEIKVNKILYRNDASIFAIRSPDHNCVMRKEKIILGPLFMLHSSH